MFLGTGTIKNEIQKQGISINKKINEIKENIPYQSDLEKEYHKLLDSNTLLKKQVKELSKNLLSLQEMNEKLLKYISNIEEVKQNGGLEVKTYHAINCNILEAVEYETITIPTIKIIKAKRRQ